MAVPRTLQAITLPATTKHTATVIFLHGLGDSGAGWAPVARLLSRNPKLQHIKWILPHAPVQRVTLNMGMSMPSWFDITSLDADLTALGEQEDQAGMLQSVIGVGNFLTGEIDGTGEEGAEGIEAKRIVVGGFSQGAALGLLTGLTNERKLGGLIALSGWLPMSSKMKSMMTDSARNTPIFFGHGLDDPVVQHEYGKKSYELLKTAPFKFKDATEENINGVSWNEYPHLEHSTSPKELKDLENWLERVLPPTTE